MARTVSTILLGFLAALAVAGSAQAASSIKHVFVIAMENHDAWQIYGKSQDAPYIQTLLRDYAHATRFLDELPDLDSEPHYIWMEAGTNHFRHHTFKTDARPSAANSTASRDHLVTQIANAPGLKWMSYQEGLTARAGACPIESSGRYKPKHNPFVFFQDVSGTPPSQDNPHCAEHIKPYTALADDLATDNVASYVFITPSLCHDMHWALGCGGTSIRRGDNWLKRELPRADRLGQRPSGRHLRHLGRRQRDATDPVPGNRPAGETRLRRRCPLRPRIDHQVGGGALRPADPAGRGRQQRPEGPVPGRHLPVGAARGPDRRAEGRRYPAAATARLAITLTRLAR